MFLSNTISRAFGVFANYKFPKFIQKYLNSLYIKIFKIDLSDFKRIEFYVSLNELFTRELVVKRKLQNQDYNLISPTDSLVMECGKIENNLALQIKGFSYPISELIGEVKSLKKYNFINLYLSPRDYHRFHAPADLEVLEVKYFSGKLLPVNKKSLLTNKYLFLINERVVIKVKIKEKIAYYVAVGAMNVGKIIINFDDRIKTNAKLGDNTYTYNSPIHLKAGEEIGRFEMGSTIVLVFEGRILVKNGYVVKMGQEIALT